MSPRFQLYAHVVSPPARCVYWFCKLHKIDFEFILVDLMKGDQLKPEFLKLNPNHKVPVLVDNKDAEPFVLTESVAILEYLCEELKLNGDWGMPTDTRERARVYEYINYHVSTVSGVVSKGFYPIFTQMKTKEDPTEALAEGAKGIREWIPQFEARLNANGGFLANGKPSICDLVAHSLLSMVSNTDIGLNTFDFTPFPVVAAWFDKVSAASGYEETHEGVKQFAAFARRP
jgi:glutathione S-transferase